MPKPSLGVMQLVHARPQYLRATWSSMSKIRLPFHLQIVLSSPTAAVMAAVDNLDVGELPFCTKVDVLPAPFNPLPPGGKERFMEMRQWQLERLPPTDFGVIWDDDHILENPHEVGGILQRDIDLTYITKAFFWGSTAQLATHFPAHTSGFTFRRLAGDSFPVDRVIHAPAKIHDCPKSVVHLNGRLLDFGYMDPVDRDRCWRDYKQVGKIDPATTALIRTPTLIPFDGEDPLK